MRRSTSSLLTCVALIFASCAGSESAPTESQIAPPSTTQPAPTEAAEVTTSTTMAPSPDVARDLVYNQDVDRQILDVHTPAGDGPFPTILAVHGGGFRLNSKNFYHLYADYFPRHGIAFVATNYRLTPGSTYPAQVEDVHCALAWIHENADVYDLDPERVVVLGGSSGGYLAAMLATVDDRELFAGDCPNVVPADPIAGAVIFYGFFDFNTIDDYPAFNQGPLFAYWGATYDELEPAQLAEMSPISWIDGSEPPFLLIHGTEDKTIPSFMSERFVVALQEAGVPAELELVQSAHAFENFPLDFPEQAASVAAIEHFIETLP